MNDSNERRKILDMLAAGQITVDQATDLLKALGPSVAEPVPPTPPQPPRPPGGIAKVLRIDIDAHGNGEGEKARIRVNVPIALAKFASKFMPKEARAQLDVQGIDLAELLDSLGDDLPEGRLVDIDAQGDAEGEGAKIIIEVV